MAEAMDLANASAPEHLVVGDENLAAMVRCAGSVFVGPWSAQAAGDYAIGSNHVLPTAGAARARGGLVRGGLRPADHGSARIARRTAPDRRHRDDAGRSRRTAGTRRLHRRKDEVMVIQGYPDPGEGLRLHLNENTGGCSAAGARGDPPRADRRMYRPIRRTATP